MAGILRRVWRACRHPARGRSGTGRQAAERYQPGPEAIAVARHRIERILTGNIIPFWYPRAIDPIHGGYRQHPDRDPASRDSDIRCLVPQARTAWFFARLAGSSFGSDGHLEAAGHGCAFLAERMWDGEHGGFFWAVDAAGRTPVQTEKHVYGQAFGLFALSEFAIASGDARAAELAHRLFHLLDARAHDAASGGYVESFARDWTPLPAGRLNVMGAPSHAKRMNTHLHLAEALIAYHALSRDPPGTQRLVELILVLGSAVVRTSHAVCTDKYAHDWTPFDGTGDARVSYGHDLENVWMLIDACRAAELPSAPIMELCRALFQSALRHGYDRTHGGFFKSGPLRGPADRREKIYWVQAESLVAALVMYERTGERLYWETFDRTLDWIVERQVDWTNGEWHPGISDAGTPFDRKAESWFAPYHQGRAMLTCLDLLRTPGAAAVP